jgi:Protein of unknown function (DUF4232)
MRIRLIAAMPAVLLLSGCAALSATVPKPAPAATGQVIPWVDGKPAIFHQGLAVPVAMALPRACKGEDLTATYRGAMGLTNGQMAGAIDLANVSSSPCVLDGVAAVDLFGAKGSTLSTSVYANPQFTATPVVLQPVGALSGDGASAAHASMEIDWSMYDETGAGSCADGLAQAAAIGITVPGGGTVTISAVSPRNDGPITFCPPRIGVGAFQPSGTTAGTPLVPGQYFEASLNVPSTAVVGHALNYQVTLKSVYDQPLTFPNGCPGYIQDLAGPGGWSLGKTWYVLNCKPMGAIIAPGATFTFAMVLQIPASAPVGDFSLAWGLDAGDSNNRALSANVTMTAH